MSVAARPSGVSAHTIGLASLALGGWLLLGGCGGESSNRSATDQELDAACATGIDAVAALNMKKASLAYDIIERWGTSLNPELEELESVYINVRLWGIGPADSPDGSSLDASSAEVVRAEFEKLGCGFARDDIEAATERLQPTTSPPPSPSTTEAPPASSTDASPPDGALALCNDGNYSTNPDLTATCSGGGGISAWLAEYVLCDDLEILRPEDGWGCSSGGEGFVRLISESEPLQLAIETLGLDAMNAVRCRDVPGPGPGLSEVAEFVCIGPGGGTGVLADAPVNAYQAVVKALLAGSEYNEVASTFVVHADTGMVVFALSDVEFWGFDGPDFETFDAIDTDCIDPSADDPALCGT